MFTVMEEWLVPWNLLSRPAAWTPIKRTLPHIGSTSTFNLLFFIIEFFFWIIFFAFLTRPPAKFHIGFWYSIQLSIWPAFSFLSARRQERPVLFSRRNLIQVASSSCVPTTTPRQLAKQPTNLANPYFTRKKAKKLGVSFNAGVFFGEKILHREEKKPQVQLEASRADALRTFGRANRLTASPHQLSYNLFLPPPLSHIRRKTHTV